MIGSAGYDWIWLDGEHGMGGFTDMVHQLQAAAATHAAPVARVVWNDFPLIKRVLDMGASGIIVPYINTAGRGHPGGAGHALPAGRHSRGGAPAARSTPLASNSMNILPGLTRNLLTAVQIETVEFVKNAEAIAAVEASIP